MAKVLFLAEHMGFYTKGVKDKALAVRLLQEEARREHDLDVPYWENHYSFSPTDITDETVKATNYYQCRKCETESIGDDNTCHECAEPCGTVGRKTFAFIA